jgi:hypothetical protein
MPTRASTPEALFADDFDPRQATLHKGLSLDLGTDVA